MTVVVEKSEPGAAPWSIMPGWGVVADLTPPELIAARGLAVLRKMIAIGLAALVVVLIAAYAFAMFRESSAQDSLDSTRDEGTSLAAKGNQYSIVTRIEGTTAGIKSQTASLMGTEVDVAGLVDDVRSALPNSMSLTSVSVSLGSGNTAASAGTDPTAGTTTTTGAAVIGTVTLSGSSQKLNDLGGFVTALQKLRGTANVLPANNTIGTGGTASWSLTMSLTDALYTHKYDASTSSSGGN